MEWMYNFKTILKIEDLEGKTVECYGKTYDLVKGFVDKTYDGDGADLTKTVMVLKSQEQNLFPIFHNRVLSVSCALNM